MTFFLTHTRAFLRSLVGCIFFCGLLSSLAKQPEPSPDALVNIKKIDPTIIVELRYATSHNIASRPLYPPDMPALVRYSTATRLVKAQAYLQSNGYCLKIWDAYRPPTAQEQLWKLSPHAAYVADPHGRGSLHSWGVAVDVTMVTADGHEVEMPTDFDAFVPAAHLHYKGNSAAASRNLRILQQAMKRGGFYGMRTEWWHFIAYDWKKYGPVQDVRLSAQ